MDLKQLRYFLTVAEEKQITAAAKRLYIAQPPLSYQLKQLEKELGVQLFVRTAHGINLTDAGRELELYAEKILSLAQTAKDHVNKTFRGELGTIKIGTVSSSAGELPTAAFKQLVQYYPDINFELDEDNTFGILEKLQNRTIDLGIVRTPFNHQGLHYQNVTDEAMALVTTDSQLLTKTKLTIAQLQGQPLIIYRRFESIFNQSFKHAGFKPFYAVKCDDARTAISWAQKGLGHALVPESIAQLFAPEQFVLIAHPSWQTHLQLVWRKERLRPLVQRIIDLF